MQDTAGILKEMNVNKTTGHKYYFDYDGNERKLTTALTSFFNLLPENL